MEDLRDYRIRQGGIPFPGVLYEMVSFMLGNKRSANEQDLVRIARNNLEDLHEGRMLSYWGSWELLVWDLMKEMEEREFVTRDGMDWVLTDKVREGLRIRPAPGVRITVHSEKTRLRRDALSYARGRASSYRAFLEEKGLFRGKVKRSFEEHWATLFWQEEGGEEEAPARRKRGTIAGFCQNYIESRQGEWISAQEVVTAFNDAHPDQPIYNVSSAWGRLQHLVFTGKVERKEGKIEGRGRPRTLFRWKEEE